MPDSQSSFWESGFNYKYDETQVQQKRRNCNRTNQSDV
jgi:hypothetical protein